MSQPASAVQGKRKENGRGRSPGVETVNRTPREARPGPVPGSKYNQAASTRASPFHAPYTQRSSTSPSVRQEAPEVPKIAAAPAACGPAWELSGAFDTDADIIQRLTPWDKFAAIVMSRLNGPMKCKGHGSKYGVSGKPDNGSP